MAEVICACWADIDINGLFAGVIHRSLQRRVIAGFAAILCLLFYKTVYSRSILEVCGILVILG